MPALPNVPNVIRCDLEWQVGEDASAITRNYFQYSGSAPSAANLNTLASGVRTAWTTNLQSLYSSSGGLVHVKLTDLASATGAVGQDTTVVSGTRSGTPLPPGVAVVINHAISRRYRGGKPRSYTPYFVSSDYSAGQWLTASQNSLNSGYSAFIAAVVALTAGSTDITAHVNVSFYSGFTSVQNPVTKRWRNVPTVRSSPLVDVISSSVTNAKPGSQRRRNLHSA